MAEESTSFAKVGHLKDVAAFTSHLRSIGAELPCDAQVLSAASGSPMAQPIDVGGGFTVGNRWCVHPMEGWDGTADGRPTELTRRRWQALFSYKTCQGSTSQRYQPGRPRRPDLPDRGIRGRHPSQLRERLGAN